MTIGALLCYNLTMEHSDKKIEKAKQKYGAKIKRLIAQANDKIQREMRDKELQNVRELIVQILLSEPSLSRKVIIKCVELDTEKTNLKLTPAIIDRLIKEVKREIREVQNEKDDPTAK